MSSLPQRPITILIAALGGEGGGVMADWLVAAATALRFPVQSTSIPGVAQRTGATTYYLELYPVPTTELGGRRPVLALTPSPGYVDLMVASELIEAGRAMQNGFVSPERTTLVASTHRVYTTLEKMQMGDGRIEADRIVTAAATLARKAHLFDMAALAQEAGTVINAVLFGAMAGSGALPIPRSVCEEVIRSTGKGVEASLKGFDSGWRHATGEAHERPAAEVKRWGDHPDERVRAKLPAETHALVEEGVARVRDFQDAAYASLYLDRVESVAAIDRAQGGGAGGYRLTNETARFLALWMAWEDVIRVADLKIRRSRVERVRGEVQAREHEPVHIVEYLKPGIEEIAAILPTRLGRALEGWARRRGIRFNRGLYLRSTSLGGFLMLRTLAGLRWLRRSSLRYGVEQAAIERWLNAVRAAASRDLGLGLEVALLARLIKGYGDTHERGEGNFRRILETLVEGSPGLSDTQRRDAIRDAREAALADPQGRKLEGNLASLGISPRPPRAQPVQFVRKPARSNSPTR
jgi:indolepyruvate ferredoxin oxidoreductase beta subunit